MIEIKTATIQDIHALAPLFDAYRVFYKKTSDLAGAQQFLEARLRNAESIVFWQPMPLTLAALSNSIRFFHRPTWHRSYCSMIFLWLQNIEESKLEWLYCNTHKNMQNHLGSKA